MLTSKNTKHRLVSKGSIFSFVNIRSVKCIQIENFRRKAAAASEQSQSARCELSKVHQKQ